MNIFEWLHMIAGNVWIYGGSFVLVLSILVFIHEWGHYYIARKCGVRVDSFSIGFGKELFGWTDKNGTRWKFSMIPLGGYVQMFGDVDPASAGHSDNVKGNEGAAARPMNEDERKVAFFNQSIGKRAAIVFAGPAINYIFAVFVLALLYTFYGQPMTQPLATAILGGSAAEKAGFEPHDKIIKIDGDEINSFEEIRRDVMVGLDEPRIFAIVRDGKEMQITTKPARLEEEDHFGFKQSRGMLGILGPDYVIDIAHISSVNGVSTEGMDADAIRKKLASMMGQKLSITMGALKDKPEAMIVRPLAAQNKALLDAAKGITNVKDQKAEAKNIKADDTVIEDNPDDLQAAIGPAGNYLVLAASTETPLMRYNIVQATAVAVKETVTITMSTFDALGQIISGDRSAKELGGIIRIGAIAGDMARSGLIALITFTALLSINLGLINLFPVPMLDGGHLLFYLLEAIKGEPISENVQEYAFRFGLIVLVGIMLFANINDIMQLIL